MSIQNKKKENKFKIISIIIPILLLLIIAIIAYNKKVNSNELIKDTQTNEQENTVLTKGQELIIPIKNISSTATFYPVEVDGATLEVLAVEAPDGSIRTAFNTCQVCYSSGKGYYEQNGDKLVCQNCGNRFSTSEVEVTRGGCNPVPIDSDKKNVDNENISISYDFLKESKDLFANWKN